MGTTRFPLEHRHGPVRLTASVAIVALLAALLLTGTWFATTVLPTPTTTLTTAVLTIPAQGVMLVTARLRGASADVKVGGVTPGQTKVQGTNDSTATTSVAPATAVKQAPALESASDSGLAATYSHYWCSIQPSRCWWGDPPSDASAR